MKSLFKYVKEPRTILNEGFIRLSQPCALNDPFEASFCKKGLEILVKHFEYFQVYHDNRTVSASEYLESNYHHMGVISLSENKENLLMWAHYADEHRGLLIGFFQHVDEYTPNMFVKLFKPQLLKSSWISNRKISLFDGIARPVLYKKSPRYRNDQFDYDYSWISEEGPNRLLYDIFMQKSDEWIYEQEYRIVLRLEQADRVVLPNLDGIENIKIRNTLLEHEHTTQINNQYIIDLYKIEVDWERENLASCLAKLSKDPNVIYLMKLRSSSIHDCILGLKHKPSKNGIDVSYALKTGRLYVYQVKKNLDYYALDFEEIERPYKGSFILYD